MKFQIYKITNLKNGKGYIGLTTKSLTDRFDEHVESGSVNAIHLAIKKYGARGFKIEPLDAAETEDEANELERHYIDFYHTFGSLPLKKRGYNMTRGGDSLRGDRRPAAAHLAHLAGSYYDSARPAPSSMSNIAEQPVGEKIDAVIQWVDVRAPSQFDSTFVRSLEEKFERDYEISDALDRIISKWKI